MPNRISLQEEDAIFNLLIADELPCGVVCCRFDEDMKILSCNRGFLELMGCSREQLTQLYQDSYTAMVASEDLDNMLVHIKTQLKTSDSCEVEYRLRRRDGHLIWVLERSRLLETTKGETVFYTMLIDISRSVAVREQLRLSLDRHKIITRQTNDIIFEWNIYGDIIEFSENAEKQLGYAPTVTDHFSQNILTTPNIHPDDRTRLCEQMRQAKRIMLEDVCFEFRLRHADGHYLWFRVRASQQCDESGWRPWKVVGILENITDEKSNTQRLMEIAQRDALTGLYNKGATEELIERLLPLLPEDAYSALLIIDVDDFKHINDRLGHLFGDSFLQEVGKLLQAQFRESDVVGRIGGDEFLVLLHNVPTPDVARRKAQQVIEHFRHLEVPEIGAIHCSVGVAITPSGEESYTSLFARADQALYQAKSQGKDRLSVSEQREDAQRPMPTSVGTRIDSDCQPASLGSHLVEYVFQVLYRSPNLEEGVQSILELVGKRFDVSRVYIFEDSEDGSHCSNTFEWVNDGVSPEMDNLQRLSYLRELQGYRTNFNEEGIFYCRDVATLPEEYQKILEPQKVKSLLQCAIRDNGSFRGFVGFDECRQNRFWTQEQIDTLVFVSEVLSTFLLKKRSQDRALEAYRSIHDILEKQKTPVYMLEPESFCLLYTNRETRMLVPGAQPGDTCYHAIFGRDTACEDCPGKALLLGEKDPCRVIYNPCIHRWSETTAVTVTWKGRQAILISCHDVTRFYDREQGGEHPPMVCPQPGKKCDREEA